MILTVASWIGAIGTIGGTITAGVLIVRKIVEAMRCILRSEMLKIYYRNCEKDTIHQYEYENFSKLYLAYKALKGNSFIEKTWEEVQNWEIISRKECKE